MLIKIREGGPLFMNNPDERLELLLARANTGDPVLDEGLPKDALAFAPKPKRAVRGDDSPRRLRHDVDANDLPAQRWGLVVPLGHEGDRMLEALTPLIRLREDEQGAKARIYRVSPNMDAKASVKWKDEVYGSEKNPVAERPLHLLMLGDLHHTSIELQHSLANSYVVGRLHFADESGATNLDGYAAYAHKVDRYARRGPAESAPNLRFYVARDGTRETQFGRTKLVEPIIEGAKGLSTANVHAISATTVDEFLSAGASANPSVLFTVSHGLGAPSGGWKSIEEQWANQGAMSLGNDQVVTAEHLRKKPFLPGGIWFFLACFGAGTPASSAYRTWLELLSKQGYCRDQTEAVLKSLPAPGERPFLAALPQAALSNPNGPLAVVGHVDLAWTFSFMGGKNFSESRQSRFSAVLDAMVRGSRAGVAFEALMRSYRDANDALMAWFELEADALALIEESRAERIERGFLWMQRNDLRGYILLGDPAARLPLRQTVVAARESSIEVGGKLENALSLSKEAAVRATIQGDETPRAIAQRAGVSLDTLWSWVGESLASIVPR